jgi:hypothetical protein
MYQTFVMYVVKSMYIFNLHRESLFQKGLLAAFHGPAFIHCTSSVQHNARPAKKTNHLITGHPARHGEEAQTLQQFE